jgi:hypothetical protein
MTGSAALTTLNESVQDNAVKHKAARYVAASAGSLVVKPILENDVSDDAVRDGIVSRLASRSMFVAIRL